MAAASQPKSSTPVAVEPVVAAVGPREGDAAVPPVAGAAVREAMSAKAAARVAVGAAAKPAKVAAKAAVEAAARPAKVAAVVVAGGSGYVQASTSVTASAGGSTWQPIVGGMLSMSSINNAGTGYGVAPNLFIAAPPSPV